MHYDAIHSITYKGGKIPTKKSFTDSSLYKYFKVYLLQRITDIGHSSICHLQRKKYLRRYPQQHMPRMPKRKKCTACDDDNCKPINCNECKFCLDMPRNGGPGKKKKACKFKRCLNQNIQPLLVNVEVPLAVSDGDVHQLSPVDVQVQDSEDEAADANVVLEELNAQLYVRPLHSSSRA